MTLLACQEQVVWLGKLSSKDREEVWQWLQCAPKAAKRDRKVVLAAVSRSGFALEFAAPELRGDREVVLAAVAQEGDALEYASVDLKADRDVVLAAVAQEGCALAWANSALQSDREVVLTACAQDGLALRFASPELHRSREAVLTAVLQDGVALRYASNMFKRNREVVLAAVTQDGRALEFATDELQQDGEIVARASQRCLEEVSSAAADGPLAGLCKSQEGTSASAEPTRRSDGNHEEEEVSEHSTRGGRDRGKRSKEEEEHEVPRVAAQPEEFTLATEEGRHEGLPVAAQEGSLVSEDWAADDSFPGDAEVFRIPPPRTFIPKRSALKHGRSVSFSCWCS